ncbi:M10 family metallopeptidase, partial [Methylobacterium trifolii]
MRGRSREDGVSSPKTVSGNASDIVEGSPDAIDPPYPTPAGPLPNAASANTATQNHNIPGTGSGSPYVDAVIWGNSGWNLSSGPITYWFGSPDDPNRPSETPLDGWSAAERQAFVGALANYAAVSNLRFEEATSEASANIVAFQVTSTAYLGLAEIPDGSVSHGGNPNQVWLRYAFNATASWSQPQPGGDGYQTILHELGHTLGLAHPQDGGSQPDATVFPGLHDGDTGLYEQNQGPYTAMTYNLDYDEAPQENFAYGENASLGAFDIAAIQRLYGVNTTYRTGNDGYALPTVNAVGTYWSTIWDAGGSDEISAAGASGPAVVDLRQAPLNGPYAGGFVSQVAGIRGGLTIANGVTIENATGGSGSDRLIGNDAANGLVGGDGDDTLVGGAGSDQLTGG